MGVIEAFVSRCTGDATLAGKISGVFPSPVPQSKSYPAISYQISSNLPDIMLTDTGDHSIITLQVNVLAYDYSEIVSIASDLKRLWSGYAGTVSPVRIVKAKIVDETDIPGGRETGSDRIIYQRSIDLVIKYEGY